MSQLSGHSGNADFESLFFTSSDGLKLHVRHYHAVESSDESLPVICLHGLARNSTDFETLARTLSQHNINSRNVIVPDYRGRGRSDYAPDWRSYTLKAELDDLLLILQEMAIKRAIFIGTSRGGLLTMALSHLHPEIIAGAVLNDIGPIMEIEGLNRIRSYVGKLDVPHDEDHAVALAKHTFGRHFTAFNDDDWRAYVRGTWHQHNRQLVLSYDPNLMKPFESIDHDKLAEPIWPMFDGLKSIPVMIIRGALSDLLSEQTLRAMLDHHPNAKAITVEGQGHAPLLRDSYTLQAIADFCSNIAP
jgi:pimeloyl-ACP methyl ester carboxylesterase